MSSIHPSISSSRVSLIKKLGRRNLYWKKHPVTLLYDYGKYYGTRPKFTFIEIHQLSGIEYACIAEMEEYFGEGKSFNKKTSKAIAATNLLQKIMYGGDLTSFIQNKKPTRYVSQTFVVSVVPDFRESEYRCSRTDSGVFSSRESVIDKILPSVEVYIPDGHNAETTTSKFDRVSPSSKDEEIMDAESEEKLDGVINADEPESAVKKSLLDEINSFCHINEELHLQMAAQVDEVDKKLKYLDPRQYLVKCCLEQGLKPPVYVATVKDTRFEAHCYLMSKLTYGKGDRISDAKQLAATRMIELFKW